MAAGRDLWRQVCSICSAPVPVYVQTVSKFASRSRRGILARQPATGTRQSTQSTRARCHRVRVRCAHAAVGPSAGAWRFPAPGPGSPDDATETELSQLARARPSAGSASTGLASSHCSYSGTASQVVYILFSSMHDDELGTENQGQNINSNAQNSVCSSPIITSC